jgi:hypothetical protein
VKERRDRLPGDLLRNAAASLLSRRLVDGVIIPALADLQHEVGQVRAAPAWRRALVLARGYFAFWSALALYLACWPARTLREDWSGSAAPGPCLLRALAPRAFLVGLVLTWAFAQSPILWASRTADPWMVALVLPSVLTISLPTAFLLGLILAMGRLAVGSVASSRERWLGPVLGLSIATAIMTFVLCGWVTPEANQSYRERFLRSRADGHVAAIAKGTRELTLGELPARIHEARMQGQSTVRLDVEWHKKWALPAACLLLGPLAIGLRGLGKRPRTTTSLVMAQAVTVLFYLGLRIGEQAAIAGHLGPVTAMWAGDALLALLTLWLIARARQPGEAITA